MVQEPCQSVPLWRHVAHCGMFGTHQGRITDSWPSRGRRNFPLRVSLRTTWPRPHGRGYFSGFAISAFEPFTSTDIAT
jgi:hypothetical protein